MSEQIDVLAVLDEFALYVRNVSSRHALQGDILEARAAVAELIDKVDSTLALGWSDTAARELRAARARIGGAK